MSERKHLISRRDTSKRVLSELSAQYDSIKKMLAENETYCSYLCLFVKCEIRHFEIALANSRHNQLTTLEKKWGALERANHQMKTYISSKEVSYKIVSILY